MKNTDREGYSQSTVPPPLYAQTKAISGIWSIKLLPTRGGRKYFRSKELQSINILPTRNGHQPKLFPCTLQHYYYPRNIYSNHDSTILKFRKKISLLFHTVISRTIYVYIILPINPSRHSVEILAASCTINDDPT